jgi:hypothetical protein
MIPVDSILTIVYLTVGTVIASFLVVDEYRTGDDVDYGMCVATGILWLPAVMFAIYLIQKAD